MGEVSCQGRLLELSWLGHGSGWGWGWGWGRLSWWSGGRTRRRRVQVRGWLWLESILRVGHWLIVVHLFLWRVVCQPPQLEPDASAIATRPDRARPQPLVARACTIARPRSPPPPAIAVLARQHSPQRPATTRQLHLVDSHDARRARVGVPPSKQRLRRAGQPRAPPPNSAPSPTPSPRSN